MKIGYDDIIDFEDIDVEDHLIVGLDAEGNLFYVDGYGVVRYSTSGAKVTVFTKDFARKCDDIGIFDTDEEAQGYIFKIIRDL